MARVYLEHNVNVDMPATKEHPGGRVIQLSRGWNELDEELELHPVLSRLIPESDSAAERRERIADAEREHAENVAKANEELSRVRAEAAQEELEERQQLSEERQGRAEEAARKGVVFNEPHPDPEAQRAISLTGHPAGHMVPAASMAQKPEAEETRKKEEEALPSEGDMQERQQNRNQRRKEESPAATSEGTSSQTDTGTERARLDDDETETETSEEEQSSGSRRGRRKTEGD